MGYMTCMGPCFACKAMFSYNPYRVPSYKEEPICQHCIELVNAKRKAAGSPLWPVPEDAYEPVEHP